MDIKARHDKIIKCAKLYKSAADGKDYRFVYADGEDTYRFIDVSFKAANFCHLVGISKRNAPKPYSMSAVYQRAITNRLSVNDYAVLKTGLCELKLQAFSSLMDFERQVKYIGFYNGVKFVLDTELITGNNTASMGFVREDNGVYYPNTVLMQDFRSLMKDRYRILAIYRKPSKDKLFDKAVMHDKRFDEGKYLETASI